MQMTKQQVERALLSPNGSESLMDRAGEAYEAAWEIFCGGGAAAGAACSFLCRCAKRKHFREDLAHKRAQSDPLPQALASSEPKMRKNAARLLGLIGTREDAERVIAALQSEQTRFVIPSLLLALGALGGEAAHAALLAHAPAPGEDKHALEERAALSTALSSFLAPPSAPRFEGLGEAREIELRAPEHLGACLAEELRELGFEARTISDSALRVKTRELAALYGARCFFEPLFPLGSAAMNAAAIAGRAAEGFRALTRELLGAEAGYRIEIQNCAERGTMSRAIAALLDGNGLSNSPSRYGAELRVECDGDTARLYARFPGLKDERFSYRAAALPASMHPVTAAAVLRSAREFMRPDARVLDPCFPASASCEGDCAALPTGQATPALPNRMRKIPPTMQRIYGFAAISSEKSHIFHSTDGLASCKFPAYPRNRMHCSAS